MEIELVPEELAFIKVTDSAWKVGSLSQSTLVLSSVSKNETKLNG